MANDLRASKSGSKLEDTSQLKKITDIHGTVNTEDIVMRSVIERFKALEEQQRTIHEEIDEIQKYIISAFGRDSSKASSQGEKGGSITISRRIKQVRGTQVQPEVQERKGLKESKVRQEQQERKAIKEMRLYIATLLLHSLQVLKGRKATKAIPEVKVLPERRERQVLKVRKAIRAIRAMLLFILILQVLN